MLLRSFSFSFNFHWGCDDFIFHSNCSFPFISWICKCSKAAHPSCQLPRFQLKPPRDMSQFSTLVEWKNIIRGLNTMQFAFGSPISSVRRCSRKNLQRWRMMKRRKIYKSNKGRVEKDFPCWTNINIGEKKYST